MGTVKRSRQHARQDNATEREQCYRASCPASGPLLYRTASFAQCPVGGVLHPYPTRKECSHEPNRFAAEQFATARRADTRAQVREQQRARTARHAAGSGYRTTVRLQVLVLSLVLAVALAVVVMIGARGDALTTLDTPRMANRSPARHVMALGTPLNQPLLARFPRLVRA